jgi:hypothetical protein
LGIHKGSGKGKKEKQWFLGCETPLNFKGALVSYMKLIRGDSFLQGTYKGNFFLIGYLYGALGLK